MGVPLRALLRGPIWSTLWALICRPFLRLRYLIVSVKRLDFEVPAGPSQDATPQRELLMAGMSAKTYRVQNLVRKECHILPDDVGITKQNMEACRCEAWVYMILGAHPLVATCLSASSNKDFIDLEFYENGNLRQYVDRNHTHITKTKLKDWAYQMIESITYVHSKRVRHADIRLDQWLLDRTFNVRISDFNASGFDPQPDFGLKGKPALGLERPSHYLPRDPGSDSTVQSDLFALGSSLYELIAGQSPYEELDDESIGLLFEKECFPSTERLLLGTIITSCWKREFLSAEDMLDYGIKHTGLKGCK